MKPPFDDLNNVTEAIRMYKDGKSLLDVQSFFDVSYRQLRKMFSIHGVPIRQNPSAPFSKVKEKHVEKIAPKFYAEETFKPVLSYKQILKKQKVKFTKLY